MLKRQPPRDEGLRCEGCGRAWLQDRERWRAYLIDDEPPVPVFFCPQCATGEFDDDKHA